MMTSLRKRIQPRPHERVSQREDLPHNFGFGGLQVDGLGRALSTYKIAQRPDEMIELANEQPVETHPTGDGGRNRGEAP